MIRSGHLAVKTVIHVSELSNLIFVCIREGLQIGSSAVGNGEGVKGDH
jgi:hypothetical protein